MTTPKVYEKLQPGIGDYCPRTISRRGNLGCDGSSKPTLGHIGGVVASTLVDNQDDGTAWRRWSGVANPDLIAGKEGGQPAECNIPKTVYFALGSCAVS